MLNIYVGEENLPKDKELIMDNEAYFAFVDTSDNSFIRRVLETVEQGSYLSEDSFIDRFGYKLPIDYISSGSQTLLNIYSHPDKLFYGGEIGMNALEVLMFLKDGNVYFEIPFNGIPEPEGEDPYEKVSVNGIVCSGVYQIDEVLTYGKIL